MRSTLRGLFMASAVLATAALATGTAAAQKRVNIPFSFTADNKICPAGTYFVEQSSIGSMVSLVSYDHSRTFSWILRPGNPNPDDPRVMLIFDQFGQRYALQSVAYEGQTTPTLDRREKRHEYAQAKQPHRIQVVTPVGQ